MNKQIEGFSKVVPYLKVKLPQHNPLPSYVAFHFNHGHIAHYDLDLNLPSLAAQVFSCSISQFTVFAAIFVATFLTETKLQLGTSSRAIHGGAYFSAVSGRKFNLTTVLRPCRPLACCWMFLFPPSVTFVLDFTELPSPMGLALYFQVDLSPKR